LTSACHPTRDAWSICRSTGGGVGVVDASGEPVDPGLAKAVINPATGRVRLLFRDPDCAAWVEPSAFYAFSDTTFYEGEQRVYSDPEGFTIEAINAPVWHGLPEGFTIEAINAPVWHGLPTVGLRVRYGAETLVFPSDTNHDLDLWQALVEERRTPDHDLDAEACGRGDRRRHQRLPRAHLE
jgi:hypothetical protein